jgi:ABC-type multidrug transport system fused ATPase/permease subunit
LRNKRAKLLRKNAPIEELNKLQAKIDKLVKTPLEPKWYELWYKITPFVYFDIISPYDEMDSTVKIKDGTSTKSNPINRGRVRSWIIGLVRSLLLASAGLGIAFSVPLWTALTVLIMLAVTLVAISVMSYYFNNKYMLGKHKQTLKEKIQRKKKLRDDIDEQRTIKIEQEREEVKNEKSI